MKLGDHVALGTDAEPREGVVVGISSDGDVLLVAWDDGGRTVIATEMIARPGSAEYASGTHGKPH